MRRTSILTASREDAKARAIIYRRDLRRADMLLGGSCTSILANVQEAG